jgi:4-amino-4-deoxy-L-arabinose transferase-like glycosyltransferase
LHRARTFHVFPIGRVNPLTPDSPFTPRRHRWQLIFGVLALLALHVGLALRAVSGKSVTVDEIFHVTGGYFYDKFGDYRIHPDNGVLPQRLHALPAVLAGAKPPRLENNEYWRTSDIYVMSYQFFYESGNDHWPMLMRARAMNLLFSLGLMLLVFGWTYRLAGPAAGFVALTLSAFSPTLLAHGPLATTDVAAAFFLTASTAAFWWQLCRGGNGRLLVSAVVFGLACVSKYSAVLLLPVYAGLISIHWFTTTQVERKPGWILTGLLAHGFVGWMIIWACFGFRYTAFAPGVPPAEHFIMRWDWMLEHAGWQGGPLRWLRNNQLFPEAFLFGYTHTYVGSLSRASYLAGEFSITGWRSFFPLAFLWKSSLPELAGLMLGLISAGLHWRKFIAWLPRMAPLLVLTGVYGFVALFSHLNIGHRHLLPMYPALFIAIGVAIAQLGTFPHLRQLAMATLIAVQPLEAGLTFPHYLAYFNPLAGGPKNGWRLLVDSSLDWGQGLPSLKQWLDTNNRGPDARPVYLSYFGSGDPRYYGIHATWLPFVNGFKFIHPRYELHGGIYCVSATTLQQVYSPVRGPWTLEHEREYQQLRAIPLRELPDNAWSRYDLLRFARLCAYLRARPPDAMADYSILIYRLSDDTVERVLNRSYKDWSDEITATLRSR